MKMFLAETWQDRSERIEVLNPYDGQIVDSVPKASLSDVEAALDSASRAARPMRKLSGYDRFRILRRAAELVEKQSEELARTITLEEGKILAEARFEVSRAVETLMVSAEEAKRISGEMVPLDGAPGAGNRLGFTLRVPCGVVLAISPFNFPLNLVAHKVGPAIAAGNSVILKPATDTPLSALKLTAILLESGLPAAGIQCLTGSGGELGKALCSDSRVRKITFTGSRDVGEQICRAAGLKKVTMELGSNAPLIIMPDADLEKVSQAVVSTGYSNAGQVCISVQRVLALRPVYAELLEALTPKVRAIRTGNPLDEAVGMGPMLRESDAIRVESWIRQAQAAGAKVVAGGQREGALHAPTLVADVRPEMRISCDELFGPAVAVSPANSIEDAIALANDTNYGLSAGIFTQSIDWAMKFAKEVDSGNLHINWGPQWRADLMPYGGLKESGFGKEGPKYAVQEMTDVKMVVLHLN
ncbi:MAG: aldehyde dehydrogenase family protein [Acidobacteria bacterium]|nr:aldehyde dehydrogenase family protein [Acidobacteriota bacterium]MCI0624763.1 aldehyde dehydrogenase family protein [Acidobacteriota bacterium]MCI0720388.1 aldehyde dehydrogenase family protein [Acidobacteriota bacterium]